MHAMLHEKVILQTTGSDRGSRLFLVCGRIPGDDDDTPQLVAAASEGAARRVFKDAMIAPLSTQVLLHLEDRHGDTCIVVECEEVGLLEPWHVVSY